MTTKKLAIASMEHHIEGDQMTVIPAKKFLEAESGTVINRRQLKTALGNLDTEHRISLATTQKLTASRHREDYDLRGPVTHAAG